jgi:hypothetical protein
MIATIHKNTKKIAKIFIQRAEPVALNKEAKSHQEDLLITTPTQVPMEIFCKQIKTIKYRKYIFRILFSSPLLENHHIFSSYSTKTIFCLDWKRHFQKQKVLWYQ